MSWFFSSFFSGPKSNSSKPSNSIVATAKKSVSECSPVKTERKRLARVLSDSEGETNDEASKVGDTADSEKTKSVAKKSSSVSKKLAEEKPAVNGTKHLKRKASPPRQSSKRAKTVANSKAEDAVAKDKNVSDVEPMSEDVEENAMDAASPTENEKKTTKTSLQKKELPKSFVLESVRLRNGGRTPDKKAVAPKSKKGKSGKQRAASSEIESQEEVPTKVTNSDQDSDGSEAGKGEGTEKIEGEAEIVRNVAEKVKGKKAKSQGKKGRSKTPSGRRKSGPAAKKGAAKVKKDAEDQPEEEKVAEEPETSKTTKSKDGKSLKKGDSVKSKDSSSDEAKDEKSSPKSTQKKETITSPNTSVNESSPTASGEKPTPLNYNSARFKYHPIDDACWERGEKVPYIALAKTLEAIESTSARLKRIEILSNLLRSVLVLTPEDLVPCVYLCLNKLAPAYEGVELGVGDMVLMKAVAQSTGRTLAKLKTEVASKGDLGLVAESSRSNQKTMFKPAPLTIRGVFAKLLEIARMTGNASMSKKMDKIQSMFVACRGCETRYLIRSLGGKLRIGLAEQSVLAGIAQAAVLTPPCQEFPPEIINSSKSMSADKYKKKLEEASLIIKTTYCECPTYDKILGVLLKDGLAALPESCHITPGVPMKPMLAHPTKGVSEVLQRFDKAKFTCEFKYDGERAQIHVLENGDIHIYSRNQENNTSKYPDIISRLSRALKDGTKSCILDSEMVAWDAEKKQILPFQVLSTRKKKDANESEIKVQVCVYAFDVLYLNGESLVKKPFIERRQVLHDAFQEVEGEFLFVRRMDADDTEKIQEFLEESIKGNCEGLMVKTLDVEATYEIAKRSHNWLKLKKDYLEGTGDTLDLVVIGGYHGKGKRTGSYGGFLLACYDETNEEFQSICKLGTGFKDEDLEKHSKFFHDHVIATPKSYYRYDNAVAPDVWFDAVQVWEIKCADLSISPVHKAALGLVDTTKGVSLRFPRFLRIRDDKSPEAATNAEQVAGMYNNQDQVKNRQSSGAANEDIEEDEY